MGRPNGAAPGDRDRLRLHLGTDQVDALVVRGPREAIDLANGASVAILRLEAAIAAAPGDRFALRHPSPGSVAGGGFVLDARPPRGISRRRLTLERATALADAPDGDIAGRVELHGALLVGGRWRLAPDVEAALRDRAVSLVDAHHAAEPRSPGLASATLRADIAIAARRLVTLARGAAAVVAGELVDRLVDDGTLARDGDRIRAAARPSGLPPETLEAMDRLEAALAVPAPPSLAAAARAAGCPPEGLRALEAAGPHRPPRGRPRLGGIDLPRARAASPVDGGRRPR